MLDSDYKIPILMDLEGTPTTQVKSVFNTDMTSMVLDIDWAKQAFLVKKDKLDDIDVRNRGFSSAWFKFTDTTLGGALCINPRPQFTRYADIREKGRMAGRVEVSPAAINGNHGMGRYYSESLDDHYQIVNMRFGVPQFNSLTQFFNNFYNNDAATLAKTGRTTTLMGKLGSFVGWVLGSVILWPVIALGHLYKFVFQKNSSKFYYLKPSMFAYWGAVSAIVNSIGVKSGLLPVTLTGPPNQAINTTYKVDDELLANIASMIPGITSKSGGYNMYAVANKAQRMSHMLQKTDYEKFNNDSYTDFKGYIQHHATEKLTSPKGEDHFFKALQMWLGSEVTIPDTPETGNVEPNNTKDTKDSTKKAIFPNKFQDYLNAELNDGAAFASFRVDYSGAVNESFSNSAGPSDLEAKINGISASARSAHFSFAGGNLIGGNIIGDMVGGALKGFADFSTGLISQFGLSGLAAFAGAAFVDIPKHWQSSTANLPRVNYTMQLISPYGNLISRMQNIYIPLAMLLAGALPLSTGKQSYTSPFILELYDRGRCQTRLGMIDSLQITRGTGNLGFNSSNQALCVDVSFSILDLSSIMHMPINKGFFFTDNDSMLDDETVYEDYIAVLSSQGIFEQLYTFPRLKLKFNKTIKKLEALTSPAMWAMMMHEKTPVGYLSFLYRGSEVIR